MEDTPLPLDGQTSLVPKLIYHLSDISPNGRAYNLNITWRDDRQAFDGAVLYQQFRVIHNGDVTGIAHKKPQINVIRGFGAELRACYWLRFAPLHQYRHWQWITAPSIACG
jgi:hypothetical protein